MNKPYLTILFIFVATSAFSAARAGNQAQKAGGFPQRFTYICTCTTHQNDALKNTGSFKIDKPLPIDNDSKAWTGCGPDALSTLIITPNSISLEIFGYQPINAGKSSISVSGELPSSFKIMHAGSSEHVTNVSCEHAP